MLYPGWRSSFTSILVKSVSTIALQINNKFPKVTSQVKEPIIGYQTEITLKDKSRPVFAYSVPYRPREQVSNELDLLVENNIIIPVKYSRWDHHNCRSH